MAHRAEKTYYLALCRKKWPPPSLHPSVELLLHALDGGNVVASEGERIHMKMVVMMLIRVILLKQNKTKQSDWMATVAGDFQLRINPCHHQCKEDPPKGVDPSVPGWGLRHTDSLFLGSLHTTFLLKLFIQLN